MAQPSDAVAVAVSETVADALERPIEDLPPLSHVIDPEAVEALVTSSAPGAASDVAVTFRYAGVRVFVLSENTVVARPICDEPREYADYDDR